MLQLLKSVPRDEEVVGAMIFSSLSFSYYLIGPSNRSIKEVEHFLKYVKQCAGANQA